MKNISRIFSFIGLIAAMFAFTDQAVSQSKKDRERAKTLQTEAERAYQQKNFQLAIDKFEQSIKLVASNPNAHYFKGSAHYLLKGESDGRLQALAVERTKQGGASGAIDGRIRDEEIENERQLTLALNHFTFALNQGYRPIDVYRQRAYVYYDLKEYDAALEDIGKALALVPNDLPLLKTMGSIYLTEKKYREALNAYNRALSAAPKDADVQYSLAIIHNALGDPAAQANAAKAAAEGGTRYPGEAFFLLGDAYERLRNDAAAIEAYRRAVFAKADLYDPYPRVALLYRKDNRLNDAIDVLKQALRIFTNDGNIYTDLSYYYSLADRPEDAAGAARSAIAVLPNSHMPHTNLCRAYNETKSYEQAIAACNAALRLKPGDGETYFYLGRAYNLVGRTADATRSYGLAVTGLTEFTRNNPDDTDGWYLLGNALFANNQREKAVDAYERCLAISPRFAKARFNLGVIQTRRKNKAGANAQYQALLQLDPKLAALLKAEIDAM
jgi:tetratricopeptide (TPR) repeat protein